MLLDGIPAGQTLRPQSVNELAEMVRHAQGSLVPMGAGKQMSFGNPLRSADNVLDLTGLSRITTYNPAELTIHVEAGTRLGTIQAALAANNQVLPLDPWSGPDCTIGGIAAANAQGPLRATGTIRDWIIGMTVVHADGVSSKTGGRVVKNVTGYDLAKLYTGSLGSLAVIAEISFKLRPRYEKTATAIARFETLAAAGQVLAAIRKGPLQPISCMLAGPEHALYVRFGEHARAVDWQISQLPPASWRTVEDTSEVAAWSELKVQHDGMGPTVVRVVGLPAQVIDIVSDYGPSSWLAHNMNGIVLMTVPDTGTIARIRERFPAIIEKASSETRRAAGVFGVTGTARRLMREMKQAMDPDGRLNPGRHIDGE